MKRALAAVVLVASTLLVAHHASAGPTPVAAAPSPEAQAPEGRADTAGLTPQLSRAISRAMAAAHAAGVPLYLSSGYRSPERQQQLFDEAVQKYGSPELASHWVLPVGRSAHVRGEAVDVAPKQGAHWLETHGVRFGLCRRYDNEYWHFEVLAAAKGSTCPAREPHA